MRLLVDEDLASRELIARLTAAFPGEVLLPDRESSDEEVWQRAQYEGAAIITGNVVDFLALARERPEHRGLLLFGRSSRSHSTRMGEDYLVGRDSFVRPAWLR